MHIIGKNFRAPCVCDLSGLTNFSQKFWKLDENIYIALCFPLLWPTTEIVLHWTVHLDDEIRSQNIHFCHSSSYSLMLFHALGSWGRAKTSFK